MIILYRVLEEFWQLLHLTELKVEIQVVPNCSCLQFAAVFHTKNLMHQNAA